MKHDDPTATSPAPTPLYEKISDVGREVAGRHAPAQTGGPAAPIDGTGMSPPGAPLVDEGVALVDRQMVKDSVFAIIQFAEGELGRALFRRALLVSKDQEFARGFVAEVCLADRDADRMANLTAVIVEKHQLAAKYMPEFALGLMVAGHFLHIRFAIGRLDDIYRQQRADEEAAKKKSATPTAPGP